MFDPGDVIRFYSDEAKKAKYHLCVSLNGHYLFLNSPKSKKYPTDFVFNCSHVPFLPPTADGKSIVSCALLMKKSDAQLRRAKAKRLGTISPPIIRQLIQFIEDSPVLTPVEKFSLLAGLTDWF